MRQEAKQKGVELQEKIAQVATTGLTEVPKVSDDSVRLVLDAYYGEVEKVDPEFEPTRKAIDESVTVVMKRLRETNPNMYKVFDRFSRDPSVEDVEGEIDYFATMIIAGSVLDSEDTQEVRNLVSKHEGSPRDRGNGLIGIMRDRIVQNIGRLPGITEEAADMVNQAFMWPNPDKIDPDEKKRDEMVTEVTERLRTENPNFMKIVDAYCDSFDPDQIYELTTQLACALALSGHNRAANNG